MSDKFFDKDAFSQFKILPFKWQKINDADDSPKFLSKDAINNISDDRINLIKKYLLGDANNSIILKSHLRFDDNRLNGKHEEYDLAYLLTAIFSSQKVLDGIDTRAFRNLHRKLDNKSKNHLDDLIYYLERAFLNGLTKEKALVLIKNISKIIADKEFKKFFGKFKQTNKK
ncbi:MAG: hypothetical protein IPJ79_10160 [Bacteroidetes bacterium]|nr:hypothetical protein [Bacteroidota bacterium]